MSTRQRKSGHGSFDEMLEALFGSGDAKASPGRQTYPTAGTVSPIPSMVHQVPKDRTCADRVAEFFSSSNDWTQAPPSLETPAATQQGRLEKTPSSKDKPRGHTDLAMKFIDRAMCWHRYVCLVAKWPDGRCEVVTFDNNEQREERRKFIDERQGKASLFVLANDLKSPVTQMPAQNDIAAVFSVQVRLSPNPHVATSPDGFASERARLRERIRKTWQFFLFYPQFGGRRPRHILDDGVSYWMRWHLATPAYLTDQIESYSFFDECEADDDVRYHQERTPIEPQRLERLANRVALLLGGDTVLKDIEFLRPGSTEHCMSEQDFAFMEALNNAGSQRKQVILEHYSPRSEVVEARLPLPGIIYLPTEEESDRYGHGPTVVLDMYSEAGNFKGDPKADDTLKELEEAFTEIDGPDLPDPFHEIRDRQARDRMRGACIADPELLEIWLGKATDKRGCRLGGEELTRRLVAKLKEHDFSDDDGKSVGYAFELGDPDLFDQEWNKKKLTNNWLDELNEKHFTAVESGKPFVYTPRHDPVLHRRVLDRSSHHEFEQIYSGRRLPVSKAKTQSIGTLWLQHPKHQDFPRGVAFMPNRDAPSDVYNLWTGWGYPLRKGDWSKMREHIRQNICSGNEEHFQYLLGWMAYAVQHPGDPGHVAIVMRGGKGVGKGMFGRWCGKLFGQHWVHIANSKLLVGNFNAHLRDAVVVFADEAFFAGDKAHEGIVKALITEPTIMIEGKFQNAVTARNCVHLIMASNDEWVVPAGIDERRFFVVDVAPHHKQDGAYFAEIDRQMEGSGASAMLHELLNMDLSSFDVRKPPKTEALTDQKVHSLDDVGRWMHDILTAGAPLTAFEDANADWTEAVDVDKDALHGLYVLSANQGGSRRVKSKSEFGKRLKKILPGLVNHRPRAGAGAGSLRSNMYTIPRLADCRADFEKFIGSMIAWDDNAGG
jgi:hypothetical protein